jgi:hypothetical protein
MGIMAYIQAKKQMFRNEQQNAQIGRQVRIETKQAQVEQLRKDNIAIQQEKELDKELRANSFLGKTSSKVAQGVSFGIAQLKEHKANVEKKNNLNAKNLTKKSQGVARGLQTAQNNQSGGGINYGMARNPFSGDSSSIKTESKGLDIGVKRKVF